MTVDLFIKKLPDVVKELIGREALENRRSVNQETIALLEEALISRVGGGKKRRNVQTLLEDYAAKRPPGPGEAGASSSI
jgi:Arc-like DNA binding domain